MSRQIDLTKPLSEDDRLYLESRGLQAQLDANALHLMGGGADETAPEEDENVEPYKGVTVTDLKTEIESRNADRAEDAKIAVAEPGNRPEIVAALVADDEASKTAE